MMDGMNEADVSALIEQKRVEYNANAETMGWQLFGKDAWNEMLSTPLQDPWLDRVRALDEADPGRICNFCYEPRGVCKLPGSYHSTVLARPEYFA